MIISIIYQNTNKKLLFGRKKILMSINTRNKIDQVENIHFIE